MEVLNVPTSRMAGSARRGAQKRAPPTQSKPSLAFRWHQALLVLAFWLTTALLGSTVWAGEFDEYSVKAAYLYNFAKYVEWPPGVFDRPDAPVMICIAGENPFGAALSVLAGKAVGSHPVDVRAVSSNTGLEKCHVVFISRAEQSRARVLLASLARLPILTVSDIDDFARAGGMIGLVEAEQRIRFDINLATARQANLKLSSQLLKLATIVE